MKNIIRSFLTPLMLVVFLVSCNEDNSNFSHDKESGWVQYIDSDDLQIIYGGVDEISIPVRLFTAVNSGLAVNYEITAVEGDFSQIISSSTGSFDIEKGDLISDLVIPISNSGLSSKVVFDVKLVSTNRNNVVAGLENERPITKRVSVCLISVAPSYTGVAYESGVEGPTFTATLTEVAGEEMTFSIDTAWGPALVAWLAGQPSLEGQYLYSGTLTVNTATGIVTVAGDDDWAHGGTGLIDACSGVITYTLNQGVFSSP